jgi:hypothetical protein
MLKIMLQNQFLLVTGNLIDGAISPGTNWSQLQRAQNSALHAKIL